MLEIIFILITLCYLLLIGRLVYGFDNVSTFTLSDCKPKTTFTVIIPFRNEVENLPFILDSILRLNYPKHLFEIVFVNDESDDNSVLIIEAFIQKHNFNNIVILQNNRQTNSPKKDAITTAIKLAKHNWIVTTDADCSVPKFWLNSFDDFIQKNETDFIAAPVTYTNTNSILKRFQLLDFLSLQGATIGGFGINKPFLCNGANLAYRKTLFLKLDGFSGNTNIASGDDIFLLEKAFKNMSKHVHYLKCKHAIVTTKPQESFKNLIAQRVRWASKTTHYKNVFGKLTGFIVLLMNATLVIAFVFFCVGEIASKTFFYLFFIKFCIDFILLFKASRFFKQEHYLSSYLFSSIVYPIFTLYVAFISVFKGYKWKGRTFSK